MKKYVLIYVLVFITLFLLYKSTTPYIKLFGGSEVVLNYREKYNELGYIAMYKNIDLTDKVKVEGKVNSNKLGVYKLTYKFRFDNKTIRKNRYVKVTDIDSPIFINDSKELYICPGELYHDKKIKVVDNYDKNVNLKIKRIGNTAIYTATDMFGNSSVLEKKIIYKDISPPKLQLLGDKEITIYTDDEYSEEGYFVSDNCDKGITDKVGVEGFVDTNTPGSYKLNYTVTDEYGNTSSDERIINVLKKGDVGSIFLTFDDGPLEGNTNEILDILREEGIKATFFVTNRGPDYLIKREYDEGHTIGLHTATHNYSYVYSSIDNYFADLESVHNRVLNITGSDSRLIRFPGGSSNTISKKYYPGIMSILTNEVVNRGYKYVDWSIVSGDAGDTKDPNEIYSRVTSNLGHDKVNIVLMHDIKSYTKDSLRSIIKYGKENGYSFKKLELDSIMVTHSVNN